MVEGKIPVDIKAKKFITKEDYDQMQRYLEAADKKLGLIVNFRMTYVKPKRIINSRYDSRHS
jgi:GxxExxY protein